MKLTSKAKAAQLLFLAAALERDWQVAVPIAEQAAWDVLVRGDSGWWTVQVKCAYRRGGGKAPYVDTMKGGGYGNHRTTSSRKYSSGDFDYLAAVDVSTREIWFIVCDLVVGKRCLALKDEWKF